MDGIIKDFEFEKVILINFINLDENDIEIVRTWRNNDNIRKWMYSEYIIGKEEHKRFIKNLKNNKKNSYWLVIDRSLDKIGVIYLNKFDYENRNAYLGIYTNPLSKKKGKGRLLMIALLNLSFKIINLHSLKLEVLKDNEKAIQFYRKWGFKKEGELREFIYKNNEWKNVLIMGIVNREVNIGQ